MGRYCLPVIISLLIIGQIASSQKTSDIRINQIGFYPSMPKIAVVRNASGGPFYIVSSLHADTLLKGTLSAAQIWNYSNESVSVADFSVLKAPGRYTIIVPGIGISISNSFNIKHHVLQDLAVGSIKGFYYQRASTALLPAQAGQWARPMGHPDTNVYIHPSAASKQRPTGTKISCPRGWYDAGDYNKYIINSGISTYTILATYEWFPEFCKRLRTNIPESGNGIPDILNEALWNVRWMLSMQDPNDGGVYAKCTDLRFDPFEMPWQDVQTRYVVKKTTAAALDFAAVMAQMARIAAGFKKRLPGFSDSCRRSALNAWNWARQNPAVYYNQRAMNAQYPDDSVKTGEYGDGNVSDEFAWAAAELFVTTAQDSFLTVANPLSVSEADLPGWSNVRTLGLYTFANQLKQIAAKVDTNAVRSQVLKLANDLKSTMTSSAYRVVMGNRASNFGWGSNSVAANQGMILLIAYRLIGDSSYRDAALSNLDYLLGRNGTTYCFVTGFGIHPPLHIHHRISGSDGIDAPVPGLLAGGPNPQMQDRFKVTTYLSSLPALAYADDMLSYASNEICINWNASLVFLSIGMEAICSPDGLPLADSKNRKDGSVHKY
jgi:endoglucanase